MKAIPTMLAPARSWNPDSDPIMVIEYHKHGKAWYPHSVLSASSTYDFDYVLNGYVVQHCSGSGSLDDGEYVLSRYCDAPEVCCRIWLSAGVKLWYDGKPATPEIACTLGYQIIAEPIGGNPFDDAQEDDSEYCAICEGRWASESTCRHIQYEDGNGFSLGCGADEVDFIETHASLTLLLRMMRPSAVDSLLESLRAIKFSSRFSDSMLGGNCHLYIDPHGPSLYCEPFGREHKYDERYWPGIAWLHSLDSKARDAVALTTGWVWAWKRSSWRGHCVLPNTHFYKEIGSADLKQWMDLDPSRPELLREKPFEQSLRIKARCANDLALVNNPKGTKEVTLRSGADSITFSVAEVKHVRRDRINMIFGSVLERNGKHISELPGYSI